MERFPLDNSQLDLYQLCPQRYHLQYELGLAGETVGPEAHFSTYLIHKPVQILYTALRDGFVPRVSIPWETLYSQFVSELRGLPPRPPLTLDTAQTLINDYVVKYFYRDVGEYEVLSVEDWATTLDGEYLSKPDVVLKHTASGRIVVLDAKFSTRRTPMASYDRQFLGQAYTYQAHRFGRIAFYAGKRDSDVDVTREIVDVRADLIAEWEVETRQLLGNVTTSRRTGVWPKISKSCNAFGRPCPRINLCAAGQFRQQLIDQTPRIDPFSYLRKEKEAA